MTSVAMTTTRLLLFSYNYVDLKKEYIGKEKPNVDTFVIEISNMVSSSEFEELQC